MFIALHIQCQDWRFANWYKYNPRKGDLDVRFNTFMNGKVKNKYPFSSTSSFSSTGFAQFLIGPDFKFSKKFTLTTRIGFSNKRNMLFRYQIAPNLKINSFHLASFLINDTDNNYLYDVYMFIGTSKFRAGIYARRNLGLGPRLDFSLPPLRFWCSINQDLESSKLYRIGTGFTINLSNPGETSKTISKDSSL